MPRKLKGKSRSKAKKSASRKPAKKRSLKKRAASKKASKKKIAKKKAAKKKVAKKKTVKRKAAARKKPSVKAAVKKMPAKPLMVEPGPQPTGIPPVEEPASHEEAVGTVTHYYSHLGVAVIQLNKGSLKVGNSIRIKGHTTDFTQKIDSMEYEHQHIDEAKVGQSFGLKVIDHAREHDIVYLLK